MVNCFGSAGTQAAGLWEFLASGSMSKVLHTANANLCGMRAAELAKLGFTGAPAILEGERAFVNALAPEHDMNNLIKGFGEGYRITENSFKPRTTVLRRSLRHMTSIRTISYPSRMIPTAPRYRLPTIHIRKIRTQRNSAFSSALPLPSFYGI